MIWLEWPGCIRRVLDISADGLSNEAVRPKYTHDLMAADGVIVNGLPILGADPERLKAYFEQEVIYGPGAFVEPADGYDDYARAIKRKLLRELTPLQLVSR